MTKARVSECLSSLDCMLKRERYYLDAEPTTGSSDSEYRALRRSLIDVFDEVFDMCRLQNRDTVLVAVSYLDRFMATQRNGFVNVELAAMTCFYLAVKLFEPTVIPPAMISELFQKTLDCEDEDDAEDAESIESMERTILAALQWKLNPPTSMMFVRQYLCCLPSATLNEWKAVALDLSRAHLEVAMRFEETCHFSASTQAVASILIAAEGLPTTLRAGIFKYFFNAVHLTAAEEQQEVFQLQSILKRLVSETIDEPATAVESEYRQKRSASYEESVQERPAKKQRSSPTSSPRSVLFAIGVISNLA